MAEPMKCPKCKGDLKELKSSHERDGVRRDQHCPKCRQYYKSTAARLEEMPPLCPKCLDALERYVDEETGHEHCANCGKVTKRYGYASIKHFGVKADRLKDGYDLSFREQVFARRWAQENDRKEHGVLGRGLLEVLLTPRSKQTGLMDAGVFGMTAVPITQRDAAVAATVIQWLGTNCGEKFLRDALAEIDKRRIRLSVKKMKAREARMAEIGRKAPGG